MIGIKCIGSYIPQNRICNKDKLKKHGLSLDFIENKIGIQSISQKNREMTTSDMCVEAFNSLSKHYKTLDTSKIDFVCVCTQNGDYTLPHTSAIVHKKLALSSNCATFDISLGCSGYIYSLLIAKSFMESNKLKRGLVFTADPYSNIIDLNDKNTSLLFGDAATVTLLSSDPIFIIGEGAFLTKGEEYGALIKEKNKKLFMDGRRIFNFVIRNVPLNIEQCLRKNRSFMNDIDIFMFHQASKYILDNLIKKLKIDEIKAPFVIGKYGNTVSSSLPLLLEEYMLDIKNKNVLLCGFGVGLSAASLILRRV